MATSLNQQIEKLEMELKEKKAQAVRMKRKERNGQLMALGIMVEAVFAGLPKTEKAMLHGWAQRLDARNKQRVLAAFARLSPEEKPSETEDKVDQQYSSLF